MQKKLRVVRPTTQGVVLFLAHGTSTEGYREGIKNLATLGKPIIASDAVAEVLTSEGVQNVTPLSKCGVWGDLYSEISMKPVLPEAVIIGMTANVADEGVISSLKRAGIPLIDLVVIDPSFMVGKRDNLMMKLKERVTVAVEEVIDSITPTVITAVTSAVKTGRIVVMSEKSLTGAVEGIKSGSFQSQEFTNEHFGKVTELAWNKYIAKLTRYVGEAFKMIFSKEAAQA
ncbi:MAG: hypothetical protein QG580_375 [Patescibacteria group bacterium]|jgi:hypothetical protein|nr:hypothetical protein [Patescibacteria group bacterium]